MSRATIPSYKWWETDGKTKRLYTELLAEKLSSPRKSAGTLNCKGSNSSEVKNTIKSAAQDTTSGGCKPKDTASLGSSKINQVEQSDKKYMFETITMDTLAKYDYIKSPKKATEGPSSPLDTKYKTQAEVRAKLLTLSPAKQTETTNKGVKNGHFLLTKKLSMPTDTESSAYESKLKTGSMTKLASVKERTPSVKQQAPEYKSSDSRHTSADRAGHSNGEKENKVSFQCSKITSSENKSIGLAHKEIGDINELTKKYQVLCDEVEQIELKLFEFSDEIHKITVGMGMKDTKAEGSNKEKSGKEMDNAGIREHRHRFTSFRDKYTLGKALATDPQNSTSKSFKSSPYRGIALAEIKSKEQLDAEIHKIKERELSEEDIQEILRCAKAKYIDNPNYLKDLGYELKPEARKND